MKLIEMSKDLKDKILLLSKEGDKSVCVESGGGIWFSHLENKEYDHWVLLSDIM